MRKTHQKIEYKKGEGHTVHSWGKIAVFIFGVAFVVVMLSIGVFTLNFGCSLVESFEKGEDSPSFTDDKLPSFSIFGRRAIASKVNGTSLSSEL